MVHARHSLSALIAASALVATVPASAQASFGEAIGMLQEGRKLMEGGQHAQAEEVLRKSLAWFTKEQGPEGREVGTVTHALGQAVHSQGRWLEAEALHRRALELRVKTLGPGHGAVADSLMSLGMLYIDLGRYDEAEAHLSQALERYQRLNDANVFAAQNNLAMLYGRQGRYETAELLYQKAIEGMARAYGPQHPVVAQSMLNLVSIYNDQGRLREADQVMRRALAIYQGALKADDPSTGFALTSLGFHHIGLGQYDEALALLGQAEALWHKALGAEHPLVAQALGNRAAALMLLDRYDEARPLLERALDLQKKLPGGGGLQLADTQEKLAGLHFEQRRYPEAEKLINAALELRIKALGPTHALVGETLLNLAQLQRALGRDKAARAALERGLSVLGSTFGERDDGVARVLGQLSTLEQAAGRLDRALELRRRATEIEEANLAVNLTIGGEPRKRATMNAMAASTRQTLAMHWGGGPQREDLARLALTTALRRKGRVLDAQVEALDALRPHLSKDDALKLDRLRSLRAQLAAQAMARPAGVGAQSAQTHVQRLETEIEALEAALSERSQAFRAQATPATIEAVQAALPTGGALLEWVIYEPRDLTPESRRGAEVPEWGEPQVGVYILKKEGGLAWVSVGSLERAAALAEALRGAILRCPAELAGGNPTRDCDAEGWNRAEVDAAARAAYDALWAPLEAELTGATHLLLAPDGPLHALPFEALLDPQGRPLLERVPLTWITTGRDLLRPTAGERPNGAPVVVADPTYQLIGLGSNQPTQGRRSRDLATTAWPRLPATAQEATSVAGRMTGAQVLTGDLAQERALKALAAPSVLHIATHGYFLTGAGTPWSGGRGFKHEGVVYIDGAPAQEGAVVPENPLLRAGLILAGANTGGAQGEDGVLTALELAGVDLWGTQLVTLSACETALGQARPGEGLYGLRRALVLAGAEAQIASLWQVSDGATRDLMIQTYGRLAQGAGRTEALRDARLALRADPATAHPWFWAAFIPVGRWSPLRGVQFQEPPPQDEATAPPTDPAEAIALPPDAGGCACRQPTHTPASAALWGALGLLGLLGLARRRRPHAPPA